MTIMILACLLIGMNQATLAGAGAQYALAETADLQFTEDSVSITVEQGGSNTGKIRLQNHGDAIGVANISFAGLEPDGITVELSATNVTVYPGDFQEVIATVSADAELLPLGPRRLDLVLVNQTSGFALDDTYLEMNVVAPSTTTPPPEVLGIPVETIVLSVVGTLAVILVVVWLRRR